MLHDCLFIYLIVLTGAVAIRAVVTSNLLHVCPLTGEKRATKEHQLAVELDISGS